MIAADGRQPFAIQTLAVTLHAGVFASFMQGRSIMQIRFCSIMVDDQDKALKFYTEVVGFVKHSDIPMGPYRWLTVTSPDGVPEAEVVLEPMGFPPAKAYQKALFDAGIPATAFITRDIQAESRRLADKGVKLRGEPKAMGSIMVVAFEDTCGNLIHLVQPEV